MNELQIFLERVVMIVEFDNTKLAQKKRKISKTPIGNPSGGIVNYIKWKHPQKKLNFLLKKHNI
jgi:hypothetical protein